MIRFGLALAFVVAACGGPKQKPDSPFVDEGSAQKETCCCKSFPISSDGKPVYEPDTNRIECGTQQGTCVDDVQCQGSEPTETPDPGEPGGDTSGDSNDSLPSTGELP